LNSILGKWIKKRNKSDFVVLILLGVMVMIVAMPTGAKQSQKETQTQEQKEQQLQTEDSSLLFVTDQGEMLAEQLQQQLKELLEHMDGVGKTRVMLTFSDEGTDQLDKNVTKDGNKKEETTVVYDTGDTRQPYVICRQMPKIEGVVVVAQGGGNAKTVTEISNAVMSLFPVEAHKVVVVKMSVQEE
jgi:stage III sporulation protein AG